MSKLNIKFLNNSVYEDKNVRFVGFTLPSNCYHKDNSYNLPKQRLKQLYSYDGL